MSKVVIFGVGQLAEVAHFYLTNDSDHDVVAFTVDREYLTGGSFQDLPVVPYEEITGRYPPTEYRLFIPISYKNMNRLRAARFDDARAKGYRFVTYISSRATYYGTPVGENCFIFEDNVIQPFTTIGDNCILWSGNHIGHHSTIGDHCFLASHVVVSGSVSIGDYCFIGVNATIRDNVSVGEANLVGAGAVVLKSTGNNAVFAARGTPLSTITSDKIKRI